MAEDRLDADAQRRFATEVVSRLRAAGHEALWAGGCVRDLLLGIRPKDYDVATSAVPEQVRAVFGRRTLAIGAAFGVMAVVGPRPAGTVEVATFRTDGDYGDGRRPDRVEFSSAEHDAQRRDFTINGLFYDPHAQRVVDYVGGRADLAARVVRAIGDAERRFAEDRLRLLRAVRITATFGFTLEETTRAAVRRHASALGAVSAERIGQEMRRMLAHATRRRALELLAETELLAVVLPEVEVIRQVAPADWEATLEAAGRSEDAGAAETLALVLAPVVELLAGRTAVDPASVPLVVPAGRGSLDGRLVQMVVDRWRLSNDDLHLATWLLERRDALVGAAERPWSSTQRSLAHRWGAALVAQHAALRPDDGLTLEFCRERLAGPVERLNPPPLVNGRDLLERGATPGAGFQAVLDRIRDAQLDGRIGTRDEALALFDGLRDAEGG